MSCLICHVDSPAESFRSYSISSSGSEGRCAIIINCWNRKFVHSAGTHTIVTSKVAPQPLLGNGQDPAGTPRLLRSRAVRRDLFQDWNFGDIGEDYRVWQ